MRYITIAFLALTGCYFEPQQVAGDGGAGAGGEAPCVISESCPGVGLPCEGDVDCFVDQCTRSICGADGRCANEPYEDGQLCFTATQAIGTCDRCMCIVPSHR